MCRSIKSLNNFDPPATKEEINAASIQFVRKITGNVKPSKVNEAAFNNAVAEISSATKILLESIKTSAKPKNRDEENEKSRLKRIKRFPNALS